MKFKYQQYLDRGYFPVIPIRLRSGNKIFDTSALIDSGATVSIMKKEVAQNLEIDVVNEKETILGGVGGRIKGYLHSLELELSSRKKFKIPVIFSHEYLVSFNLLGRDSFFNQFKITFDEKNKIVELI